MVVCVGYIDNISEIPITSVQKTPCVCFPILSDILTSQTRIYTAPIPFQGSVLLPPVVVLANAEAISSIPCELAAKEIWGRNTEY